MQFLIIGAALFIAAQTFAPEQLQSADNFDIAVDSKTLTHYLQLQAKSFSPTDAEQKFIALSEQEKQILIDDYVRDQVLFREAMALGLDDNDEVIRRRLIQKMEYIAQGFYQDIEPLDEADLGAFFAENREDYRVAASVSFTHVFFDSNKHGADKAEQLAGKSLTELNRNATAFNDAAQFGDRFLFSRNYIERTVEYIRGHFGLGFEEQLFSLKPSDQWQGPFQSNYGFHLLLMKETSETRLPQLEEVSGIVLADARRQQQQDLKKQAVDQLIEKYTVTRTANPS